ncbi:MULTISPECIES: crotonyl-CoA carboxylase/reductase [unclassified Streptomyces]|uniref:crotonyl-CoA carboxylase/reductase n=1 Tax=unclassified Streptomyces TaxID=2593676 RepID=UPI002E29958E|nr:crotonyl-CoA carboxylase/reductase [Streptomyces sp. NBC_01439]
MTQAVLSGLSGKELARCAAPTSTLGLVIRRSDESLFEGADDSDIDVRKTLHVEEVPLPELAPDEALIAVMASAVNYNTVWSATFRPVSTFRLIDRSAREDQGLTRHVMDRHVLGSDAAGVIVRVGASVRHWRVGDHVVVSTLHADEQDPATQWDGMLSASQRAWGYETNFGGLAHYSIVKSTQLLPKPAHLTWEEAACNTLCLMTAYRMLISDRGARVKLGDLVLIWGATGGLGVYATQLAKAAGCQVIGVVSDARKARVARALGCDLVIDRHDVPGPDGLASLAGRRWLGSRIRDRFGEDPHCVFEHVGRPTFGASVFLARRGGTIVTCGSSGGYAHDYDNRHLWTNLKRIVGSHGANYQEATEANRLVSLGRVMPGLSEVHPLLKAAEGVHRVHRNLHLGKVGVLCLAPSAGLGVTDPEFRAGIPAERLRLLRSDAEAAGS